MATRIDSYGHQREGRTPYTYCVQLLGYRDKWWEFELKGICEKGIPPSCRMGCLWMRDGSWLSVIGCFRYELSRGGKRGDQRTTSGNSVRGTKAGHSVSHRSEFSPAVALGLQMTVKYHGTIRLSPINRGSPAQNPSMESTLATHFLVPQWGL